VQAGKDVLRQAPHRDDLPLGDRVGREDAFRRLSGVDLVQLGADRYVVAYPFSSEPTGHTVQLDDGPVPNAMCAIDALRLPLVTGRDAVIASSDPSDGQPIRVVRRGSGGQWTPDDTVVLLAQSSGHRPAADCLYTAITFHASHRPSRGTPAGPARVDRRSA
jgi:alkylmercury lyase